MILHATEIAGIDKPIVTEKPVGMFTFEELEYLHEDVTNYINVALLETGEDFYEKLYSKK